MALEHQYEIRLYRDDGTLSVVMPYAANVYVATLQAERMLNGELTTAQIWHDYKLVRTLEYGNGKTVAE